MGLSVLETMASATSVDGAVLYDTEEMVAFGPVFQDRAEAEAFIYWAAASRKRWWEFAVTDWAKQYEEFKTKRADRKGRAG